MSKEELLNEAIINLKDPDFQTRKWAVSSLGYIGGDKALSLLFQALKDEDGEIRYAAAISLAHLGEKKATNALVEAFNDPEGYVRMAVVHALGRTGNHQVIDLLFAALQDKEGMVRCSAASALAYLDGSAAIEPLIKALADEDEEVRSKVRSVLGVLADMLKDKRIEEALAEDKRNLGINPNAPLYTIQVEFATKFRMWELALPAENVAQREAGFIAKVGWYIRFIFGVENEREYAEFYSYHRMPEDGHFRIYEDGQWEALDIVRDGRREGESETDYRLRVSQLEKDLRAKGLYD